MKNNRFLLLIWFLMLVNISCNYSMVVDHNGELCTLDACNIMNNNPYKNCSRTIPISLEIPTKLSSLFAHTMVTTYLPLNLVEALIAIIKNKSISDAEGIIQSNDQKYGDRITINKKLSELSLQETSYINKLPVEIADQVYKYVVRNSSKPEKVTLSLFALAQVLKYGIEHKLMPDIITENKCSCAKQRRTKGCCSLDDILEAVETIKRWQCFLDIKNLNTNRYLVIIPERDSYIGSEISRPLSLAFSTLNISWRHEDPLPPV